MTLKGTWRWWRARSLGWLDDRYEWLRYNLWAKIKTRWFQWFDEQPDESVPREWVILGIVGSGLVWWWGQRRWGDGFNENVMSNLVLIGPALLITHVVGRTWRNKRSKKWLERRLLMPMGNMAFSLGHPILRTIEGLQLYLPDYKMRTGSRNGEVDEKSAASVAEFYLYKTTNLVGMLDKLMLNNELLEAVWQHRMNIPIDEQALRGARFAMTQMKPYIHTHMMEMHLEYAETQYVRLWQSLHEIRHEAVARAPGEPPFGPAAFIAGVRAIAFEIEAFWHDLLYEVDSPIP